jgi:hypothetical protein
MVSLENSESLANVGVQTEEKRRIRIIDKMISEYLPLIILPPRAGETN